MTSLFEQVTDPLTLLAAWRTILAHDAEDGEVQRQNQRIAADPEGFAAALSGELRDGSYVPAPLAEVAIPKKDPAERRLLRIPSVRDRVVERAVTDTLGHRLDLVQSPCSFAYRRGLGVDDAVDHLVTLRGLGSSCVLRTDIDDFFPHTDVEDALAVLAQVVPCRDTQALVRLIASPRTSWSHRRVRTRGLAQGSSLSPLLANLALTPVDHAMTEAGFGYLRFADDIVVCAATRGELCDALIMLTSQIAVMGLSLDEGKTIMTTFDEGFTYLGVDFSASKPPPDPYHDVDKTAHPDHVLYVGREGARVRVSQERLIVDTDGGLPYASIPRKAVRRIVLSGAVGLSAGARSWALYNDIDVIFLSRRGGYLGQLAGPRSTANASRLLTQAAFCEDDARCLPLARAIVRAKLRHQTNVLRRVGRRGLAETVTETCSALRDAVREAGAAADVQELMGVEGAASARYFACVSALLPEEMRFTARSRRPPLDLPNAALSYAYAILLGECVGALLAAGLEPSLGVLHSSTDKRPSLALDLMEEFRPLLVDRTVVALLRTGRLRAEHAVPSPDGEGVWLSRDGKKALVDGYEATMQRQVKGALPGFSGTWRRHLHHEAQLLGRAIAEPGYEWVGASWR